MKNRAAARECYHCKQWIEEGQEHDCWTTTEAALTRGLNEQLREAWERLRETAMEFGEQRIYAAHKSIMFARKTCYFFVRPRKSYLELVFFLDREITAPSIHKVMRTSKTKLAHIVRIVHRDEVEVPLTTWLHDAWKLAPPSPQPSQPSAARTSRAARSPDSTAPSR